ncbi:sugar kinase [Roseibium sediminicola]|uniref:Sugar kinase n=1 Tax=Roseibium sediminicola TaxID=2933272 RepID=A0ABT0GWB0_9HYPH|nr:sugar kinase [Roseibium sp. CAU 1639]MCK7613731.1 sugar kinase [Roseibium sp. CAU 1639]
MRFLSIGECMAEFAPCGTPGTFRMGFAGDTFNTLWYLRALRPDIEAAYFTAVGTDNISDSLIRQMQVAGIDTSLILRRSDRTIGLYLIELADGERSFSYWRNMSAAKCLAEEIETLTEAIAAADVIYFSGITLAILKADTRGSLLETLRQAHAAGKTVAFDPNLRPGLWPDPETMKTVVMSGASASNIVLPSFEDEALHFGDADPGATIERYLCAGADRVIVKNGPHPVAFGHQGKRDTVPVARISNIVDTTAAGDSFNAGYFAELDRDIPQHDMIAAASRVAAKVIQGPGALVQL